MDNNINENEILQSPLVVHKETDASYQNTANDVDVEVTHIEDDSTTLERHRFRRERKKSKGPAVLAVVLVIAVGLAAYLYFAKGFDFGLKKEETTTEATTTAYYTPEENKFEGIITVKGTYLFFEGEELDGVEDLVSEIKYLDKGTKFIVQDESADATFLNEEVLTTLSNYGVDYEVKYIISSGLMSRYETTAPTTTQAPTETTTAATTAEAE